MLSAEQIVFRYDRRSPAVLDNVSLTLETGQVGVLLGRNGCGKTTLLKTLLGLCRPEAGRITFDGEELTVDCLMCAVCNGRTYGGGFYAAPEAQPDDGWLDVFIIRRVSRLTIARLLGMYKSGRHFRNGELTEQAKPYFIYRRAKCVSLRPADGRGPIVATADGECAPCDAITAQLKPLAGRVLLPKPAYKRFMAQRANV